MTQQQQRNPRIPSGKELKEVSTETVATAGGAPSSDAATKVNPLVGPLRAICTPTAIYRHDPYSNYGGCRVYASEEYVRQQGFTKPQRLCAQLLWNVYWDIVPSQGSVAWEDLELAFVLRCETLDCVALKELLLRRPKWLLDNFCPQLHWFTYRQHQRAIPDHSFRVTHRGSEVETVMNEDAVLLKAFTTSEVRRLVHHTAATELRDRWNKLRYGKKLRDRRVGDDLLLSFSSLRSLIAKEALKTLPVLLPSSTSNHSPSSSVPPPTISLRYLRQFIQEHLLRFGNQFPATPEGFQAFLAAFTTEEEIRATERLIEEHREMNTVSRTLSEYQYQVGEVDSHHHDASGSAMESSLKTLAIGDDNSTDDLLTEPNGLSSSSEECWSNKSAASSTGDFDSRCPPAQELK